MTDRRCVCGGRATTIRTTRMVGISMSTRHRCEDCQSVFDVTTPLGAGVMSLLGLALLLGTWLAPTGRFASADDRLWILLMATAMSVALIGIAVNGLRRARERPPW
jgi:hypothetical protein